MLESAVRFCPQDRVRCELVNLFKKVLRDRTAARLW